jgi:predicted negative regulator of RcsB-dependent stress response
VESYSTEEEQVEALRRWWDENGRSTIIAIVVALSAGFGWQAWKSYDQKSMESASNIYQTMLQSMSVENATPIENAVTADLAVRLKDEHQGSSYAQFAALQLASMAVAEDNLPEAESQLRWVLSRADKGGDIAQVTELRLARVLAASGQAEQALDVLQQAGSVSYSASYALARGDVLLQLGRTEEARDAYTDAKALAGQNGGQVNLATLDQKLQSLNPQSAREPAMVDVAAEAAAEAVAREEE